MFCRNCGCKNEEGAKFCKRCGTSIVPNTNEQVQNISVSKVHKKSKRSQGKSKKSSKKAYIIIFFIILLFIAIVLGVLFIRNIKTNINLNKYVEVNFDGYDGYGQATVSIDWDEIERQYGSKLSYKKKVRFEDMNMPTSKTEFMQDCISIDLDQEKSLSNGDSVTYECSVNAEELSNYLNCEIIVESKVVEVSGLEEVDSFNPFEALSVTFSGREPHGCLSMEYNGEILSVSDFHSDKEAELKNNDKITIVLEVDDIESFIKTHGKVPSVTEREYTVSELEQGVVNLVQIDTKVQDSMKRKAEEIIRSYSATGREEEVNTMNYVGCYLQLDEENPKYNRYGVIYQIIPIEAAWEDPGYIDIIQYYDLQFENLTLTSDNSCKVDLERYEVDYFDTLVQLKDFHQGMYNNQYSIEWKIDNEEQYSVPNESTDRLCEYSSTRLIEDSEILNYLDKDYSSYHFPGNRNIAQMIINEMYALKGYQFADKELEEYFNQKMWYKNIEYRTKDMDVIRESMSTIEQENVTVLEKYRE